MTAAIPQVPPRLALSRLDGITLSDLAKIIGCLKRINLNLDTDVLWIEEYKDYYIKKKQRT